MEMGKATHSSTLAWRISWTVYIVHGVTKSRTQLSDFHFTCHDYPHDSSLTCQGSCPLSLTQEISWPTGGGMGWVPTLTLNLSLYSRFKGTSRPLPESKTSNKGGIAHFFIYGGGGSGLATKSCLTFMTPWTVARQVPLSLGFSRQEYWSGLPFPSPSLYILCHNIVFRVILLTYLKFFGVTT